MDSGIKGGARGVDGECVSSPSYELCLTSSRGPTGDNWIVRSFVGLFDARIGAGGGERFRIGSAWSLPSPAVAYRLSSDREGDSVMLSLLGAKEYREVFFRMRGGECSRRGVRDFVIGSKNEKSAKSVLERTLRSGGWRAVGVLDGVPLES